MKSTKVQTLGAVTLHATTDCTDDASIVGLGPFIWAYSLVSCLVLSRISHLTQVIRQLLDMHNGAWSMRCGRRGSDMLLSMGVLRA